LVFRLRKFYNVSNATFGNWLKTL